MGSGNNDVLDVAVNDAVKQDIFPFLREKLLQILGDAFDPSDDTLLEYIVLLVQNKRTKAEIAKELEGFVGDDARGFVNWLWQLFLDRFVKSKNKVAAEPQTQLAQAPPQPSPQQQVTRRTSNADVVKISAKASKTLVSSVSQTVASPAKRSSPSLKRRTSLLSKAAADAARDSSRAKNQRIVARTDLALLRKPARGEQHRELRTRHHKSERVAKSKDDRNRSGRTHEPANQAAPVEGGAGGNRQIRGLKRIRRTSEAKTEDLGRRGDQKRGRDAGCMRTVHEDEGAEHKRQRQRSLRSDPEKVRITIANDRTRVDPMATKYTAAHLRKTAPTRDSESGAASSPAHASASASTRLKIPCSFWPKCEKGDACLYLHPSTSSKPICRFFPKCSFGDKCMYQHPQPSSASSPSVSSNVPCRFGASCHRPNCMFAHPQRPRVDGSKGSSAPDQCRYDPKCTKIACKFAHPKRDAASSAFHAGDMDDDDDESQDVHVQLGQNRPESVVATSQQTPLQAS